MHQRPDPGRPDGRPPVPHGPAPVDDRDRDQLPELLACLGEELSKPLASLRSEVGGLLSDPGNAVSVNQSVQLRTMAGLCDDLLDLTRDYLDYAQLARGARSPRFETVGLSCVVAAIDCRFRPEAEARGLSWGCTLDGPDADARVVTDPEVCRELAGHLIGNALKSTPAGGSVVAAVRGEGAWWTLTVSDTGPGIPEGDRDKVFEPFYRLPRDDRDGDGGCGLGLPTCRELVSRLGGSIAIGPEAGQGATVTVRLPVGGA